jgi:hypothetical protein
LLQVILSATRSKGDKRSSLFVRNVSDYEKKVF